MTEYIEIGLGLTRLVCFIWAFLLFMVMLNFGLLDLWLSRKCSHTHVAPEFRLWAAAGFTGVVVYLAATFEEALVDESPGYSLLAVIVYLFIVSCATYQGASRVQHHRISIARGHCGNNDHPHSHEDHQ